jgi:hypothetical protein
VKDLQHLQTQRSEAVQCVKKDTRRLVNSEKLAELVNRQAKYENDYEFLHSKKKNIELSKLKRHITPEMESLFDNATRVMPGGVSLGDIKVANNKGQTVDLGKIEKMIRDDFSELEKKLDKISSKLNTDKMSNVEVAKLNNTIATIKKNV